MIKLHQILIIAKSVWLENIRSRAFVFLSGFGIVSLFCSVFLANMAVGDIGRVLQNYGFWIIGMWGLVLSLFFGVNIIKQELMNKTIYLLLSRPVERFVFILGKFLGILVLISMIFFIIALVFTLQLKIFGIQTGFNLWIALFFIYCEWILLAAFSIFFAALTSPALHIFFLTGLYFMGHWSESLYIYSKNIDGVFQQKILAFLYWVIPNLEAFSFREAALYTQPIDNAILINSFAVCLCWTISVLAFAILAFNNKKLI